MWKKFRLYRQHVSVVIHKIVRSSSTAAKGMAGWGNSKLQLTREMDSHYRNISDLKPFITSLYHTK